MKKIYGGKDRPQKPGIGNGLPGRKSKGVLLQTKNYALNIFIGCNGMKPETVVHRFSTLSYEWAILFAFYPIYSLRYPLKIDRQPSHKVCFSADKTEAAFTGERLCVKRFVASFLRYRWAPKKCGFKRYRLVGLVWTKKGKRKSTNRREKAAHKQKFGFKDNLVSYTSKARAAFSLSR